MNSNQLPLSGGVAIFFAVIVSYFVLDPTALEGFRPIGDNRDIKQVHGMEDVQARLWQDPFAAAALHSSSQEKGPGQIRLSGKAIITPLREKESPGFELTLQPSKLISGKQTEETERHSLKKIVEEMEEEAKEGGAKGVTVVAAMVSAGPYAKQAETRLRTRYAILSALGAEKYFPKHAEHIGFVNNLNKSTIVHDKNPLLLNKFGKTCEEKDKTEETCKRVLDLKVDKEQLPFVMPYEWYERKQKEEEHILLLWLDEDAFQHKPLAKLNLLFDSLGDHISKVKLIGPYGSTVLKEMVGEAREYRHESSKYLEILKKKVEVYSATATAVASVLIGEPVEGKENLHTFLGSENKSYECGNVFRLFKRTITTDGKLTQEIVKELRKRVNPKEAEGPDFHVAIVSEWDTTYGRALPDAFEDALGDAFGDVEACRKWKNIKNKKCNKQELEIYEENHKKEIAEYKKNHKKEIAEYKNSHVHLFKYMRGIDGALAASDYNGQNKKKGVAESGDNDKTTIVERPEGRSQKDYLRRLSDQILDMDRRMKSTEDISIRAIGVLGSDVYDKLLILRALRGKFPNTIFFTTDLDASLLHPENYPWTRNLIVASGFGLSEGPYKSQDGDNKTCQLTSGMPSFRDNYQTSIFQSVRLSLRPHCNKVVIKSDIYEVGHNGAFNLMKFDNDKGNKKPPTYFLLFYFIFIIAFLVWYQRWYLTTKKYNNEKTKAWEYSQPILFAVIGSLVIFLLAFFLINYIGIAAIFIPLVIQILFLLWLTDSQFRKRRVGCQKEMPCKKDVSIACESGCSFSSSCPVYKPFFIQSSGYKFVAFIIFIVLSLAVMIYFSGEPISFTSGISIWPAEILRIIAGTLSIILLFRGRFLINKNTDEINKCDEFLLSKEKNADDIEDNEDIQKIWIINRDNDGKIQRRLRIASLWLVYFILCSIIIQFNPPHVPFRGIETFWFDKVIIIFCIFSYTWLIFAVIDSTMLCRRFIDHLIHIDTKWSFMRDSVPPLESKVSKTKQEDHERWIGIKRECRREWSEIKLIAKRTEGISQLVYYPIFVALLLIASRSNYFDNWNLPVGLAFVISLSILLVICCAFLLRKSANNAKAASLRKIRRHKEELLEDGHKLSEEIIKRVEYYENQISSIKEGAFLPITEQPWVQAATLLFGGGGSLILFEMMALG